MPSQLSGQKSVLLTCKILVLLVNTLAGLEKYPVLITDNLTISVQMRLPSKQKTFPQFFHAFFKSILIFRHFLKNMTLVAFVFLRLRTAKTWLDKYLKSAVWEDPWKSNMVKVHKRCWNLHHRTFIIFIDPCQFNLVGKTLFYWHAKSWYCLVKNWLKMKSILFLIKTI